MTARLVLVGVPGDKRTAALAAAVARQGVTARLVSWRAALADPRCVGAAGDPGDFLRVESPGGDAATWEALARLGGEQETLAPYQWRPGRGWFAGLSAFLRAVDGHTAHLRPTHPSAHILAATDKIVCHDRLAAAGVPVPARLPLVATADALRAAMDERELGAVYVKPRWGSSGAGVLALRRDRRRGRERVDTTAQLDGGKLYNCKSLRRHEARADIDRLLDCVLADGAIVQRWIPKRGTVDGPFDVRVLVLRGRIALAVARVGRGTITNLHLDARRLDFGAAMAPLGDVARRALEQACLDAAACFPGQHALGVDVMLDPRGRPFVLECNAWGDYLPRLQADGLDSHDLYLRDLFGAPAATSVGTGTLDEAATPATPAPGATRQGAGA